MKIGWFFTEMWRYIDFQNGSRPPSWNCFTTIWDHSRSPCCWPQLPVKCHDTQIWRYSCFDFSHIWLEMPIKVPKLGFWGTLDYSSSRPTKGTSLRKSASFKLTHSLVDLPRWGLATADDHSDIFLLHCARSFKLSTVKIRWGDWTVGELTESVMDTHRQTQVHTGKFVFCPCTALDRQIRG